MDTLIDNRNFPEEMHEHPTTKKNHSQKYWIIAIFILALVCIAGYFLFFNKDTQTKPDIIDEEQKPLTEKETRDNINALQKIVPQETRQQRDADLQVFFN